jgi:hypothetical protein
MRTSEQSVPQTTPLDVESGIATLGISKSPGNDEIRAELVQAGSETLHPKIHKFMNSVWDEEELPDQWRESIIVPIYKKGDKTIVIIEAYHCYQLHTQFLSSILFSMLSPYVDEIIGDHQCGFRRNRSTVNQTYFRSSDTGEILEYNETIYHLFIRVQESL